MAFAPDVPVAAFALIAGTFERRALAFDGTEYELLIHPTHIDNVRRFDELGGAFASWLGAAYLEPAIASGLDYPYGTFSLVEVPARLRRYGGSWRLDTVQALPGVQLLSEQGFPTRLFSPTDEDGLRRQMRDLDRMGPNTIHASAGILRNLLPFLAAPTGNGALALDVLIEILLVRWAGLPRWANFHAVVPPAHWLSLPAQTVPVLPIERVSGRTALRPLTDRLVGDADWRRLEQAPLVEVDPSAEPESFAFLAHRCDQVARAMHSLLGQERTLDLLALLRSEHQGSTYTTADFVTAVRSIDPSVADLVNRWLHEPSAPGFTASSAEVSRIADGPGGKPRYQVFGYMYATPKTSQESSPSRGATRHPPGSSTPARRHSIGVGRSGWKPTRPSRWASSSRCHPSRCASIHSCRGTGSRCVSRKLRAHHAMPPTTNSWSAPGLVPGGFPASWSTTSTLASSWLPMRRRPVEQATV